MFKITKILPSCTLFIIGLFFISASYAAEYTLPNENSRLIGKLQYHTVEKGDYFQKIAEQYDVGFLALMAANPNVDPFLPAIGQQLIIPSEMILPYGKREGIIINLPELRLYYFPPGENRVHVFPVGIGRQGLSTPETISYIGEKRKNPTWRPTEDMKARYFAEHGKHLSDVVPAGPNNPFGKYALRLGTSVYLLHGSNQRFGIGMRASSGCIRLYDEDIKWLYDNVKSNTPVRIVSQPIKMSYELEQKIIEVHSPLSLDDNSIAPSTITDAVTRFVGDSAENKALLMSLVNKPKGLVSTLTLLN